MDGVGYGSVCWLRSMAVIIVQRKDECRLSSRLRWSSTSRTETSYSSLHADHGTAPHSGVFEHRQKSSCSLGPGIPQKNVEFLTRRAHSIFSCLILAWGVQPHVHCHFLERDRRRWRQCWVMLSVDGKRKEQGLGVSIGGGLRQDKRDRFFVSGFSGSAIWLAVKSG